MKMKELFGKIKQFDNPFNSDSIETIRFNYRRKDCFGKEVNEFYATIEFRNGNTSGEHKINADSFPELYDKVMEFCDNL